MAVLGTDLEPDDEKIVAALWATENEAREAFGTRLLRELPGFLVAAAATGIRLNIRDEAVKPAEARDRPTRGCGPVLGRIRQCALPWRRRPGSQCGRSALCCVAGLRVHHYSKQDRSNWRGRAPPGWSQASFVSLRDDVPREEAMSNWLGHHTKVAIEVQANFEYSQKSRRPPVHRGRAGLRCVRRGVFPCRRNGRSHCALRCDRRQCFARGPHRRDDGELRGPSRFLPNGHRPPQPVHYGGKAS